MSHDRYEGRSVERSDTASRSQLRALAATLDCAIPGGEELPPLWHWMLFQDWAAGRDLGADGHPSRGGFLPEDPAYPRRMWAGGRLSFERAVCIGRDARRQSRVLHATEKQGSTGRALWVSVEHVLTDERGTLLTEQQDLVYRAAASASSSPPPPPAPQAAPGVVREARAIDAVLLFRYSALTGNAHRIHYDLDYARNQEGYEGLVVQGALQATLLADFAQRQSPAKALREFAFRARWPALLHRCPMTLEAWPLTGTWQLRSLDSHGVVCMSAEARFEP
ncbi:MAG: acyl-CoA dehydrogenase [Steroidobacteraceae bacterium]